MPMSMPSHIRAEKAGNTQKEISHMLSGVCIERVGDVVGEVCKARSFSARLVGGEI